MEGRHEVTCARSSAFGHVTKQAAQAAAAMARTMNQATRHELWQDEATLRWHWRAYITID